jgi:hypothetical protein
MNSMPLIVVDGLRKVYTRGTFKKRIIFQLEANFTFQQPTIVAMIGPNGAGKTTLLDLIAGKTTPTSGKVICLGKNIHKIKYKERKFIVNHHYPPAQFRRFKYWWEYTLRQLSRTPNFLLEPAGRSNRMIHLYDELNTEDGYSGLLFNRFSKLKREGHLVLFCIHPTKPFHLKIMRKICEHYIFVYKGMLTHMPDFKTFFKDKRVRDYLGDLVEGVE